MLVTYFEFWCPGLVWKDSGSPTNFVSNIHQWWIITNIDVTGTRWTSLKIILDNRVKQIQIYIDENDAIEGITLVSHFVEPNFKQERRFGKTTKAENICSFCELELAEDEVITGLSYRKSTAGVGEFRIKWNSKICPVGQNRIFCH